MVNVLLIWLTPVVQWISLYPESVVIESPVKQSLDSSQQPEFDKKIQKSLLIRVVGTCFNQASKI